MTARVEEAEGGTTDNSWLVTDDSRRESCLPDRSGVNTGMQQLLGQLLTTGHQGGRLA